MIEAGRDDVRILGVNQIGRESSNALITEGCTIPWLQDAVAQSVWASWAVTYRDVVILNDENVAVSIYNLTVNDLGIAANCDSLRALILRAAQ